jgi:alpha-L-fucosidase
MTMNDTWGYKQYDQNWKPDGDLIRKLVDVASKGGNFLLNVGPDGLGQIPQPSVERLKAMGKWIKVNGEAIYGTSASPFAKLPWGRCTQKPGKLYLHVFNWPANGRLTVPGLKSGVRSAQLLSGGKQLEVTSSGKDKLIKLPTDAPDPVTSVICVQLAGPIDVDNDLPSPAADGKVSLPLWMADIHNQGNRTEARLGENQGKPAIVDWNDQKSYMGWSFEILQPGSYEIIATLEVEKPGVKLKMQIGKESATANLTPGGQPVKLGTISITAAGIHELTLRPVPDGWQPVILRSVTLRPVPPPQP